jgi:hypothetical protein
MSLSRDNDSVKGYCCGEPKCDMGLTSTVGTDPVLSAASDI